METSNPLNFEAELSFSLLLGTVERTEEVNRLLGSLSLQTYKNFELIVVDQNGDDRITSILQPYQNLLSIIHLRRPQYRGLSKARNLGMPHVNGSIVTYPDDDCWYPPWLLEKVAESLVSRPEIDGLSGRMGSEGEPAPENLIPPGLKDHILRTPLDAIRIPGMWGLFLRTPVAMKIGEFDESLGVGASTPWGAGEDTDYYLRILKAGFNLYANPDLVVFHTDVEKYYEKGEDLGRTYRYGSGLARVWRRHRLPVWFFVCEVLRSSAGVLLSLITGKIHKTYWHWGALRGKVKGWFSG